MRKFLIFITSTEQYAVAIENIITIDKVEYEKDTYKDYRIKKVPAYPEYIEGLFSYKGHIMPVINFETFIADNTALHRHDENKIIFIKGRTIDYGILINDVSSIIELDDDDFLQIYKDYPLYTVEKKGEIYIVPDIDKMLDDPSLRNVFADIHKQ